MTKRLIIFCTVLFVSGFTLSFPATAGFEWLPDGQTPYADAQSPKPTMRLPSSSVPNNSGRGVGATSGQGIFLPLPGQPQTAVNPTPRTSSPKIVPPVPVQNPMPQTNRQIPQFSSSMPQLRNAPSAAQNVLSMRDNSSAYKGTPVSGSFKMAEGFGSDIPLAMALNQVVPPGYAYAFGNGVNPGYRVSWNGGKPWNEVVFDMIAPIGLVAYVRGNKLFINKRSSSTEQSMVMDVSQVSAMSPSMSSAPMAGDVPAPPPFVPLPMMSQGQNSAQGSYNNAGSVTDKGPKYQDGSVSLDGGRSNILDPGHHKRQQNAKTISKIKRWTNFDEIVKKEKKPRLTDVPLTQSSQNINSPIKPVITQPIMPPPSQKFAYQTSMMEDVNQPATWQARQGDSLFGVLQRWSDQANMKLIWAAGTDYLVANDVFVNGPFPQALEDIITNGVLGGHRPAVDFYETPTEVHEGTVVIRDR